MVKAHLHDQLQHPASDALIRADPPAVQVSDVSKMIDWTSTLALAPSTQRSLPLPSTPRENDGAIAGFTEQLYVAHRATDGWNRQSQYDASRVRAFVLAPVTVVAPIAVP